MPQLEKLEGGFVVYENPFAVPTIRTPDGAPSVMSSRFDSTGVWGAMRIWHAPEELGKNVKTSFFSGGT